MNVFLSKMSKSTPEHLESQTPCVEAEAGKTYKPDSALSGGTGQNSSKLL